MSLADLLANAQSPERDTRESAFALLSQHKANDLAKYLVGLSNVLAAPGNAQSRQLAALELKNSLIQHGPWDTVAAQDKNTVKCNVLGALADDSAGVRRVAAQAVAAVAKQELAQGASVDLLDTLTVNASNVNEGFRVASLMTLGYICDDLPPVCMPPDKVNGILTVIAQGLTASTPEVTIVSLRALSNCLLLAERNMAVDSERECIFQLVWAVCRSPIEQLKTEALMVQCEIVSKYYDLLQGHIQSIAELTFSIIANDNDTVAALAIEVWNLIADVELERCEHHSHNRPCRGYIGAAAEKLIQLLLVNITRMGETEDWDLSKSCASTLTVVFQITKDKYIELPSKLIRANLLANEWRLQKAACLVLGSILEGPSQLQALVSTSVASLVGILTNSPREVCEAAAWALSKICELHYKVVSQPGFFNSLVPALCTLLQEQPKAACHACWALLNLIEKSAEIKLFKLDVFEYVIKALYAATQRQDAVDSEHHLQDAAFFAIAALIENSPGDCEDSILASIDGFVDLLGQAVHSNENLQNSLCSVIEASFNRVSNVPEATSSKFMANILSIFTHKGHPTEEGIQAIGALTNCLQSQFLGYLSAVGPPLAYSLSHPQAVSLCKSGTMLIGDIARALQGASGQYIDDLVPPLLSNLIKSEISGEIKLQSIESLADIAANTHAVFNKYITQTLALIDSASTVSLQETEDPDLAEYLKALREAIAQFYENFVQGQVAGANLDGLLQYVPGLLRYILSVTTAKYAPSTALHTACAGAIGDIASAYGQRVRELLRVPQVFGYLQLHRTSGDLKLREVVNWAFNIVNSI